MAGCRLRRHRRHHSTFGEAPSPSLRCWAHGRWTPSGRPWRGTSGARCFHLMGSSPSAIMPSAFSLALASSVIGLDDHLGHFDPRSRRLHDVLHLVTSLRQPHGGVVGHEVHYRYEHDDGDPDDTALLDQPPAHPPHAVDPLGYVVHRLHPHVRHGIHPARRGLGGVHGWWWRLGIPGACERHGEAPVHDWVADPGAASPPHTRHTLPLPQVGKSASSSAYPCQSNESALVALSQ